MTSQEEDARRVCATLRQAGYRALLAGGCVRDLLLGNAPHDFDVATSAPAEEVLQLFPRTAPVGVAFGVVLVLMPSGPVEVATFRKDGPYSDGRRPDSVQFCDEVEDAQRRDFTINALFLDPETNDILDYVGGQADLKAGRIVTVGAPILRFREDRLRLLRAIRFAARFDYGITAEVFACIQELASEIHITSADRIRQELVKMLVDRNRKRAIELLDASGLLKEILPEVAAMKGVEQPPEFHPEGDVFEHTKLVLENLDTPTPALAMGALLHDVGKAPTQTFSDRIRFHGHDRVGAEMAAKICERLHFSNADSARIVWLVKQHMRMPAMPEMRESKRRRLLAEPGFSELLALCRADALGGSRNLDTIKWIERYRASIPETDTHPEPLLRGGDLIDLGYKPGPRFKKMLRAVEDAQLEGSIRTKDDAINYVKAHYRLGKPGGR